MCGVWLYGCLFVFVFLLTGGEAGRLMTDIEEVMVVTQRMEETMKMYVILEQVPKKLFV